MLFEYTDIPLGVFDYFSAYVVRKLWIGTIHGLRCPKYGSVLCATIHGLSAQSMDRANEGLEVWISAKPLMHGRS